MDMYYKSWMISKRKTEFNLREFVEFSIYSSEGSVPYHKIEEKSELGQKLATYAKAEFQMRIENPKMYANVTAYFPREIKVIKSTVEVQEPFLVTPEPVKIDIVKSAVCQRAAFELHQKKYNSYDEIINFYFSLYNAFDGEK